MTQSSVNEINVKHKLIPKPRKARSKRTDFSCRLHASVLVSCCHFYKNFETFCWHSNCQYFPPLQFWRIYATEAVLDYVEMTKLEMS